VAYQYHFDAAPRTAKQFHGTTLRAVLNAAAKRIIEEEKSEREP